MKKLYLAMVTFLAAFAVQTTCSAQQIRRGAVSNQLTWAASQGRTLKTAPSASIVIVDEDFSGLTAGTEDAPDNNILEDNLGWVNTGLKPYHESCTKPWGGMGLTSAGGTIAVTDGFLNTPTGDYSGTLKMTCRVRLPKGTVVTDWSGNVLEQVPLDIILLRRSVFQDFKRVTYYLTEEWQEITFEAENGWFSDTMIQFFTAYNMTFLVDDVKIEHVINSIEYPHADNATTVSDDTFIANWDGTATAEEYLLSVYTKEENPVSDVEEGDFETINTTDGKMIDEANPGYPEGWDINVTAAGTERHMFTEAGMFYSGKQSVCLDADGDYIQNRIAKDPIKELHFWINVDDSQMADGDESASTLIIQVNNGTSWFDLFYLSVEGARQYADGVMVDGTEYLSMVDKVMQVRIVYNKDISDGCMVAIDDFGFTAPGQPVKNYLFEDKALPAKDGCSYKVTVPDPNAEYFYYLKARNSMFTSDMSNEVEVFDVHEPVALPATNITSDSYVANWQCGPKSDFFTVNQYLRYTASEDVAEYVILEEDFSKVVSTAAPSAPEIGEEVKDYVSLNQYTKTPGWKAGSYAIAEGMLGGLEASYPYRIGSVLLPEMDLSNNGGVCNITIRAYAQKGDWIIVGGNSQITVGAMEFVETGLQEMTMTLEGCSNKEVFEIYTQNYGTFLIDYIKVSQPLKSGEQVTILTDSKVTDNAEDRSIAFTDAPFTEGLDLCYSVFAHRIFHGNAEDIWRSHKSNTIVVDNNATGICQAVQELPSCIEVREGGIAVTMSEEGMVKVYDFSGRLVTSAVLAAGENLVQLSNGAYVVCVPGVGQAKVVIN